MNSSRRIAVLGAGYVGRAVATTLVQAGHAVWAVRRTPQPPQPGLTWLAGDIASGPVPGMPAALDAVVLTVAPSGLADSYDRVYPPSARAALALARTTGAGTVTYTSSTGVYGGRDGAWITEASARAGEGPGNAALKAAEDALLESGMAGVSVLRVAGIYGPGRDPRGRFADPARLPMRGAYWVNFAHQHDIVAAIVGALAHAGPPRVLNVADGTPTQAADIARWLAAARGADPAALVFADAGAPSRSNQRISNAALVATGWQARYPSFREGFTSGL